MPYDLSVFGQPIERLGYLRHDIRQRRVGRQRISGNGNRPAMGGDAFDQHGKYFARIALPIAAVQEDQAGCRLVGGRIEIDLRPFAVAIGYIEKGFAAGAQRFGQLVSFGDQRRAVLYRRIVVIGGVALGLRKRGPVQPGIEEFHPLSPRYQSRTSLLQKPKRLLLFKSLSDDRQYIGAAKLRNRKNNKRSGSASGPKGFGRHKSITTSPSGREQQISTLPSAGASIGSGR